MKNREKTVRKNKPKVVAVSGGFDPIHIGHVRMFQAARKLGDRIVVILNNDNWIQQKKWFVFMPQHERKEILEAIEGVHKVIFSKHAPNPKDMSVCLELKALKPQVFAKGGDRDKKDSENKLSSLNPEKILCEELGIKLVYGVGRGGKIQSSSLLVDKAKNNK